MKSAKKTNTDILVATDVLLDLWEIMLFKIVYDEENV